MIQKFGVENFKGFKDRIDIDFSNTREYSFNSDLIKHKTVNKAIIYGKNGSGKSNLGLAMFDIKAHLNDEVPKPGTYSNADNPSLDVKFFYTFKFGKDIVNYEYIKTSPTFLIKEKLSVNGNIYLEHDHMKKITLNNVKGFENLKIDLPQNHVSVIRNFNSIAGLEKDHIIFKLLEFVKNMLWFRSLNQGNEYMGVEQGVGVLANKIYKRDALKEFNELLNDQGMDYILKYEKSPLSNNMQIMAKFKNKNLPLSSVASNGTISLFLFYYWSLDFNNLSFFFIDEFDALYHFETAEYILRFLNKFENLQSVVTTHNTYLMDNKYGRPDTCYIIESNKVNNLSDSTDKELREAHNIGKMYRKGAFEK